MFEEILLHGVKFYLRRDSRLFIDNREKILLLSSPFRRTPFFHFAEG